MTGCLLGPPVEGPPEEELYPPRIVLDAVRPPPQGDLQVETADLCEMMEFSLGRVADRNVNDALVVRWFLDWAGKDSTKGWIYDRNVSNTGGVERTDPVALVFQLNISDLLDPSKPHSVTAVLADRTLLNNVGIGFTNPDEGQYDLYQWDFRLNSGGRCTRDK